MLINSNSLNFDGVLLNGVLSEYTLRYLLLRKLGLARRFNTIIMPRGDLAQGALSLKDRKKRAFLKFAKKIKLYDGLSWLVTSDAEKKDTITVFGDNDISVVSNLPYESSLNNEGKCHDLKKKGELDIIYVARITEVKNLLFALKVLNRVRGRVNFNIYGPVFDVVYWGRCQEFIGDMNSNIKVTYHGSLPHEEVECAMLKSDVLFLPTLGENYGHAIVEALVSGVPVVVSDRTPWRDLKSHHAGWDISLNQEKNFIDAIQTLVDMEGDQLMDFRRGAMRYIKNMLQVSETMEAYRELFTGLSIVLCKLLQRIC